MQKHIHNSQINHVLTHRVITLLNREEMDFLDKVGKDALFSTGHKLSYNAILKGLIDMAIELGLKNEKIDSIKTLKEKLKEHLNSLGVHLADERHKNPAGDYNKKTT